MIRKELTGNERIYDRINDYTKSMNRIESKMNNLSGDKKFDDKWNQLERQRKIYLGHINYDRKKLV